jgi:serine/threonine protein kinase
MFLLCPNGHRSEVPVDGQTGTTAEQVPCPVCGAAAVPAVDEVQTPVPAALSDRPSGAPLVPGYEVLSELGRGGMGVVYKACQVKLDRLVALKVLPPETAADPAFAERFTREARALARLNHPHIIAIYDFGQEGALSYFVMEYVAGVNLRDRLRQGPLPPHEALAIMDQLCEALQYAHEEGIVHRDIKPENVLLDRRGRVKVADFGIAKLLQGQTGLYTLTGPWQVVGTVRYMAPEQMDNPLGLDHRADIYSLGVVFYEMLTGGLPVGRFPRPSEKSAVDPRLDEVVLTALDADPARRFQQARELRAAIEAVTGQAPTGPQATDAVSQSRPVPKLGPEPDSATEALPVGLSPPVDGKAVRRRLRLPADLLSVTGIAAFVGPLLALLAVTLSAWPTPEQWVAWLILFAETFLAPLSGFVVLRGAWKMRRLESYRWSVAACVLALIPWNPLCFLLGVPAAICGLVLLNPKVRAAFPGMTARPKRPSRIGHLVRTTTGWAVILCLAGVVFSLQPIWPWADLRLTPSNGEPLVLARVYGYETICGQVSAGVFLGVLLVLAVAAFPGRVPIWQPILFLVSGLGACLFVLSGMVGSAIMTHSESGENGSKGTFTQTAFHKTFTGDFICRDAGIRGLPNLMAQAQYRLAGAERGLERYEGILFEGAPTPQATLAHLRFAIHPASWVPVALGAGLFLLGALQLRGILRRRQEPVGFG